MRRRSRARSSPICGRAIVDLTAPETARGWSSIDDVLMDGVSASRIRVERDRTSFADEASLASGGGFAPVLSVPREPPLGGTGGVALEQQREARPLAARERSAARVRGWRKARGALAVGARLGRGRDALHH
ncbi:MAG: CIA30 family protein [Planctomycetes bacterium]|nr:CIA30 family protein [Planctomycetota bacterium]